MGGYGYDQSSNPGSSGIPSGGGNENTGGNPGAVMAGYNAIHGAMTSAAASSAATSAAAGSAAEAGTSSAVGSAVASGSGAATSASAADLAAVFAFYGGESVSQIKSSSAHHVEVCGGMDGLNHTEEKGFYKNVHIPRKQV